MNYQNYVNSLKAMSDENRLKIIELISDRTLCACDLLDYFNFTQPTLSHHMKILEDSGIVKSYREGKWKHYSLNEEFASGFFENTKQLLSSNSKCVCDYNKK
ncbi:metalloregulator ArsR/SmtB family transcription factor [Companilactobacillus allii]|uniref:Transcriptional regulator n=1 Tax=Companilactobacillus allii TaxID=1847728 RepID=A0A1P8Q071_9LACO|nr:metalloregulator ArsR/SmtB family transcription factor [Companilactobacillus allii]APX71274.1 transcriptional regulator [Companilactobacillus allii]USQ68356.1 metalloregulator ArsR/SmtB family transcription factor [Companilactobacillus allii]